MSIARRNAVKLITSRNVVVIIVISKQNVAHGTEC